MASQNDLLHYNSVICIIKSREWYQITQNWHSDPQWLSNSWLTQKQNMAHILGVGMGDGKRIIRKFWHESKNSGHKLNGQFCGIIQKICRFKYSCIYITHHFLCHAASINKLQKLREQTLIQTINMDYVLHRISTSGNVQGIFLHHNYMYTKVSVFKL